MNQEHWLYIYIDSSSLNVNCKNFQLKENDTNGI